MSKSIKKKISRLIRPEVQEMQAYHVAESKGLIKLDAMENPYTWPKKLIKQWAEGIRSLNLNRYPDASAKDTKTALRQVMQIPDDMEILLGNGSDELILLLMLAVCRQGATVMAPVPTFVMYEMLAKTVGMSFVGVPLKQDFALDLPVFLERIHQVKPAIVFLSYPNNPSGNLFAADEIEAILQNSPGLVILDEAYSDFTDKTFMQRLGEFDNLLVLRTVSKIGLAGLRLGLLAGPPSWLQQIDKLRLPYNIGSLTQFTAEFILQHQEVLQQQTQRIRQHREQLMAAQREIDGVTVWPSETNFILFRCKTLTAPELFQGLLKSKVLVKNLHGSHPLLQDCLRVTVGTEAENEVFMTALRRILKQ